MLFGLLLRNMGPKSTREVILECARAADESAIDELWVTDHIAIPPDDAEGSGGRYLDPLATLAFVAAATERVRIGSGVLVLPYRPPLPTAKWIATIQELCGNRLMLGVGAGWMRAEFAALGVARSQRGKITDETLRFIHRCFAADEVEANDQKFLFLPRPPRPPIFVGGTPPHALRRTVEFGEGWMPIRSDKAALEPAIKQLYDLADAAGKPRPEVVLMSALPLDNPARAVDEAGELAAIGVTRFVHAGPYKDATAFAENAGIIAEQVKPALAG
jgi:probable F420-dependent oxidoreductase